MKAKTMNQGIGLAVTRLLNWAEGQGFQLTVSPIQVEAGTGKDWMVTLRACRQDGADIQARLGVDVMGEIIPNALRRDWDSQAQAMTEWAGFDAAGVR